MTLITTNLNKALEKIQYIQYIDLSTGLLKDWNGRNVLEAGH